MHKRTRTHDGDYLPRCSRCSEPVKYATGSECENCYADSASRWHGDSQTVNTTIAPRVEEPAAKLSSTIDLPSLAGRLEAATEKGATAA